MTTVWILLGGAALAVLVLFVERMVWYATIRSVGEGLGASWDHAERNLTTSTGSFRIPQDLIDDLAAKSREDDRREVFRESD